jgi:hypothetical protein
MYVNGEVSLTGSNAVNIQGRSYGAGQYSFLTNADYPDNTGFTNTLLVAPAYSNGNGLDKVRNNTQGTLLASQARTATALSPNQTNYNARGVILFLNVTTSSGTGGITVTVQGVDPVTGSNSSIFTASSAITGTGIKKYILYPGASGGSIDSIAGIPLPRTWFIQVNHSDSSSYTYSVGYSLIL